MCGFTWPIPPTCRSTPDRFQSTLLTIDCCIIGGGIIGLSIARELAGRGCRVRLLAREPRRQTSSWAAAGILPPAPLPNQPDPKAALTALSDRLHWQWAAELRAETGIDNGLRRCGGVYLARDASGLESLHVEADRWRGQGVTCAWLDRQELLAAEPGLATAVVEGRITGGFLLPEEARIRPPWQLDALERSCLARGVSLGHSAAVERVEVAGGRVTGLGVRGERGTETVAADCYVLAAGAWSGGLAGQFGLRLDTRPIRGQIALVRFSGQPLGHVVNLGLDYLVPREDGRVLVGSTLEDSGFDPVTVPATIEALLAMASELLGDLSTAVVERAWAGLRPGSVDGLPTIGPVPGYDNAFVATGHFRAGIHQSPGTAVIVADLVEGKSPPVEITAFAHDRASGSCGQR